MKMKNKIVARIVIITTIALVLLSMVIVSIVNYANYKATEKNMVKIAAVYESMIRDMTHDELVTRFQNNSDDVARVTIFNNDKKVIVDNFNALNEMSSLYSDSDIENLMSGHVIKRLKVDNKHNKLWFNYAFKVDNIHMDGGCMLVNIGYIYENDMSMVYWRFPMFIVLIIVTCIVATFFTNKLINTAITPFELIQESLEDINRGEYHQITLNTKYDDISNVVREINDVSAKISNSINYLEYEQKKSGFLLENMWQGVLAISKKGKIILANNAIKDIFKYDKNILGCEITFLSDVELLNENVRLAVENGENKSFDTTIKDKVYHIDISQIDEKWFEEFRGIAVIVLFTDITEEFNSNRIRSEFFANASHELKTPLTAIKGYAELMETIDSKEVSSKCIDEINKNAKKMLTLIQDMLKLSKLDAKIMDEEFTTVDLRAESEEVIGNLMPLALENNITIKVEGEGSIRGMHKLIDEMITNIVGNAIKYNRENGSIDIIIESHADSVVFKVSDTGIGIPREDQPRIFERFYLPDKGRNKKIMSTGLGLAIVKHIVMEHGAKITVESEEGVGTTFIVTFPTVEAMPLLDGSTAQE